MTTKEYYMARYPGGKSRRVYEGSELKYCISQGMQIKSPGQPWPTTYILVMLPGGDASKAYQIGWERSLAGARWVALGQIKNMNDKVKIYKEKSYIGYVTKSPRFMFVLSSGKRYDINHLGYIKKK